MADIDTKARHETVNFLRNFQETNSAQKPNEHSACYSIFAFGCDLSLNFCFCDCKSWSGKNGCKQNDEQ